MRISGPLQVIPRGFLGFFQLKNGGVNPTEMPDSLQCVLEMRDWYFNANAETFDVGSVAVAGGTTGNVAWTSPVIVPNDEFWWVTEYNARTAALLAADTSEFCMCYVAPVGAAQGIYQLGGMSTVKTGPNARAYAFARGFWLPPGAELQLLIASNASAGNITYAGSLRAVRLPA